MACPHFVDDRLCRCCAVAGLLIPSVYERERFCRGDESFHSCPTFCAFAKRQSKLPQEVYYSFWLPALTEQTERGEDEPPSPSPELHPGSV